MDTNEHVDSARSYEVEAYRRFEDAQSVDQLRGRVRTALDQRLTVYLIRYEDLYEASSLGDGVFVAVTRWAYLSEEAAEGYAKEHTKDFAHFMVYSRQLTLEDGSGEFIVVDEGVGESTNNLRHFASDIVGWLTAAS